MPSTKRAAPTEAAIRESAYYLWEQSGRPEGRDLEFWSKALAQAVMPRKRASKPAPAKASAA